jgi:hypothetical protein
MGKKVRRRSTKAAAAKRRKTKYSPWEIFLAGLGGLILLLAIGLVISTVFGG